MVSLVEAECEPASNALKITYDESSEDKADIGICVKGLHFPDRDISAQLAEWIEISMALGAKMIHFYTYSIHDNIIKGKYSKLLIHRIPLKRQPIWRPFKREADNI